ncbi:unnamed protein product [Protopolystoma xenopodis]|uniref:Uncharacterized protein n=1 Tax=Protopolystoma xenopodis TaxID=117903 RepID=A0A448WQ60_9PLAT|nr:unnamed protein product [Protopolystoma xenopodis]
MGASESDEISQEAHQLLLDSGGALAGAFLRAAETAGRMANLLDRQPLLTPALMPPGRRTGNRVGEAVATANSGASGPLLAHRLRQTTQVS